MIIRNTIKTEGKVYAGTTPVHRVVVYIEPKEDPLVVRGRELWQELHARPMTQHQFELWCNRVPAFGCSCRKDLLAYIDEHPVDWDNFYEWGVSLHDAVNRKLGKPVWNRVT